MTNSQVDIQKAVELAKEELEALNDLETYPLGFVIDGKIHREICESLLNLHGEVERLQKEKKDFDTFRRIDAETYMKGSKAIQRGFKVCSKFIEGGKHCGVEWRRGGRG